MADLAVPTGLGTISEERNWVMMTNGGSRYLKIP